MSKRYYILENFTRPLVDSWAPEAEPRKRAGINVWFGSLGGSRTVRQQTREVVLKEFLTVMENVEGQECSVL